MPSELRIYIAAPWKFKAYAAQIASKIESQGDLRFVVQSRWHDLTVDDDNTALWEHEAHNDISDVFDCDVMLVLNLEKSEGKAFEQGMAYTLGKPIIVWGEPTNVFHALHHKFKFTYDWDSTWDLLTRLADVRVSPMTLPVRVMA